jgi:hypothetical protein
LLEHVKGIQSGATDDVEKWLNSIKERELAEKRRVAPGWLDVEAGGRMLTPARKAGGESTPEIAVLDKGTARVEESSDEEDEGKELDRAFGEMKMY